MAKTKALKIEQEIIQDLSATPHANSGAMKKKHDASDDSFLYEIKTTEASQYTFKFDYFREVRKQAYRRLRIPTMIIADTKGKNTADSSEKFVILDYDDFIELKKGVGN